MPLGLRREVVPPHHPSPSSDCRIMGILVVLDMKTTIKGEKLSLPFIESIFSCKYSTGYFLYHHKIKSICAKIKLTLEHMRQMRCSETNPRFSVCWRPGSAYLNSFTGLARGLRAQSPPSSAGDGGFRSTPGWEGPLEKEVATHSSTLAWRIPWMEETGGLQSMG